MVAGGENILGAGFLQNIEASPEVLPPPSTHPHRPDYQPNALRPGQHARTRATDLQINPTDLQPTRTGHPPGVRDPDETSQLHRPSTQDSAVRRATYDAHERSVAGTSQYDNEYYYGERRPGTKGATQVDNARVPKTLSHQMGDQAQIASRQGQQLPPNPREFRRLHETMPPRNPTPTNRGPQMGGGEVRSGSTVKPKILIACGILMLFILVTVITLLRQYDKEIREFLTTL